MIAAAQSTSAMIRERVAWAFASGVGVNIGASALAAAAAAFVETFAIGLNPSSVSPEHRVSRCDKKLAGYYQLS